MSINETSFKNQSKYVIYHIIENSDETFKNSKYSNFMISDITHEMKKHSIQKPILYIMKNEGTEEYKKKYLDEIISKFSKDYIICTCAYASKDEFPSSKYYLGKPEVGKEPLPIDEILDRERKILEEKGFISINSYVAYEYKDVFIYLNNEGTILASYMRK